MINYYRFGYSSQDDLRNALKLLHFEKKMSQSQIANHYMVSRHTIIRAFKELNINVTNYNELYIKCGFNNDSDLATEIFKLYYEQNLSINQISEHFKVSVDAIRWCMDRNNIIKKNESKGALFKILEPTITELEIINGLLLGDAQIKLDDNGGHLIFTDSSEQLINSLNIDLNRFNPTIIKQNKSYKLITKSLPLLYDLYNKWYSNHCKLIPDNIDFSRNCVYWWYLVKGSSMNGSIKIYGTSKENIKIILEKFPIRINWYDSDNNIIIFISKESDRKKFFNYIGKCRHNDYNYKWLLYRNNKSIVADFR